MGEETVTEESEEETTTGEDIIAMKGVVMARAMKGGLNMKSVGDEIEMKVGEIEIKVGEIEITEEREIGKETAEVQARGTIEEIEMQMIEAGRGIMTEKDREEEKARIMALEAKMLRDSK